jgi:hypothetical protein
MSRKSYQYFFKVIKHFTWRRTFLTRHNFLYILWLYAYFCVFKLQTRYFQKTEISLHVSVIYRHAMLEYDHVDSTEENPNVVAEYFFVLSPDPVHDEKSCTQIQSCRGRFPSNCFNWLDCQFALNWWAGEYDHVDSTEENPNVVAEYFFVLSPDPVHDDHFTYQIQKMISEYLESISYNTEVILLFPFRV